MSFHAPAVLTVDRRYSAPSSYSRQDATSSLHTTSERRPSLARTLERCESVLNLHLVLDRGDATSSLHRTVDQRDSTSSLHRTADQRDSTSSLHRTVDRRDSTSSLHRTSDSLDAPFVLHSVNSVSSTEGLSHAWSRYDECLKHLQGLNEQEEQRDSDNVEIREDISRLRASNQDLLHQVADFADQVRCIEVERSEQEQALHCAAEEEEQRESENAQLRQEVSKLLASNQDLMLQVANFTVPVPNSVVDRSNRENRRSLPFFARACGVLTKRREVTAIASCAPLRNNVESERDAEAASTSFIHNCDKTKLDEERPCYRDV